MRLILFFLCCIMFSGTAYAAVDNVGREMRSVELQRQADESGRWLKEANVLYFKVVSADQVVDPDQKAELEKIADPYRWRFLKPEQADHLCGLVKDLLKQKGYVLDGFYCSVKSGTLEIKIKP